MALPPLRTAIALGLVGIWALATACDQEPATPSEQPIISLLIVSGDGQFGVVGAELPNPAVIKATDSKGKPIVGIAVNFRVTSGGGSVFAGAATTDVKGIAQDYWTLGTSAGAQTLEVRAVSATGEKQVFGVFTANGLPAAVVRVVLQAGDGQIAPHGTNVPILPAVLVTDQYDNPVPAHPVTFAIGLGGGSITGASATTDANGIATVGSWTLGSTVCPNSLTATAAGGGIGGNPVSFSATGGDCWTSYAGLLTARQNHAVGVVNGLLYAVGGYSGAPTGSLERYQPGTNSWAARVSMPTPRYAVAAGVANGTLYAVGGSSVNNGPMLGVVEAYDPVGNSWSTKASMPTPRRALAIGVVNGILYTVGGLDGAGVTGTVEAYDPATNTWTTKASMPTPRSYLAVGVANGILYAFGGFGIAGGSVNTVEAYDPVTNSWTTRASMPTSRAALSVAEVNGILFAMGGDPFPSGSVTNLVQAYDPTANSWTTKAPMPAGGRGYGSAGVVNGVIYMVGGNNGPGWIGTVEGYVP